MTFHPAAQILTWCILVEMVQRLSVGLLLMSACLILMSAFLFSRHKLFQLLRRTRWVIISLLLVYSYSTPGQTLFEFLGILSPTLEGATDGVLQLTRLLCTLAGLAILLDRLSRLQLITGVYTLFAPMEWIGFSRERLAVRLALTLYYAEEAMMNRTNAWQDCLRGLFEFEPDTTQTIELSSIAFSFKDILLIILSLVMFGVTFR